MNIWVNLETIRAMTWSRLRNLFAAVWIALGGLALVAAQMTPATLNEVEIIGHTPVQAAPRLPDLGLRPHRRHSRQRPSLQEVYGVKSPLLERPGPT